MNPAGAGVAERQREVRVDEVGSDVSVVIPCFRSGATIERAVASVVGQTQRPCEVILVDDASGDGSVAGLHDLAGRHPGLVRVLALGRNGGAGAARNAGWDQAAGRLVAFLDADDSWHPAKLEVQAGYMRRRPDLALTGTASRVVPPVTGAAAEAAAELAEAEATAELADAAPAVEPSPAATPVTPQALLRSNSFLTSSTMVRRGLCLRFPVRRSAEDYTLWLQVVLGGHGAAVLDDVLAYRHKDAFGAGGLSGRLWRMEVGEVAALRQARRGGLLSRAAYCSAVLWSLAKFARRLAVVGRRAVRPRH